MSIVLAGVSALALLIGWRWGVIAIHGGSVERAMNPRLFWMAMIFAALLLVTALTLLFAGK